MLLLNRISLIVFSLVAATFLGAHSKTAPLKIKKNELQLFVHTVATQCMHENQIPGIAIALYDHNKSYLFHYGHSNKQKKTQVTDKTLFEIGSVSKLFTCLLLSHEVLEGTLKLSDSIQKHVPRLAPNNNFKNISLEKLGTHTGGFPFNATWGTRTEQAHFDYFLAWKPTNTYELPWEYSNHGIELLRVALEKTCNESVENLLSKKILQPLGMELAGINVPPQNKQYYAQGYDKKNMVAPQWNHPFYIGTAAVRASSSDMLKFLKAAIGLPGTPTKVKKAMRMAQTPYVEINEIFHHGLGWEIHDLISLNSETSYSSYHAYPARHLSKKEQVFDGNVLLSKGGTTDGFHAYIGVIPNQKTGVVILMNHAFPPNGWKAVKKLGKNILSRLVKA